MIALLAAALVGGSIGFVLFFPYGALAALLGAQMGASLLTLTAGLLLGLLRAKAGGKQGAAFRLYRVVSRP